MIKQAVLDAMLAAGCTAEQIVAAIAADRGDASAGAVRQARYRANKKRNDDERSVTDSDVTLRNDDESDAGNVTDRNEAGSVSLSPVPLLSPHTPLITPLPPNPSQKQTARGTRLPDDWQLTGPDLAYALSKGLFESEIAALGERFSSWAWSASGPNAVKKNWHQAWRGWVQREAAGIIKNRGSSSGKPLTAFQQRRSETQDILNGLDSFSAGSGLSSEKDTRLLGHDPGQRPPAVRGWSGQDADDFPFAGDRAGN